ncbi:hypothetical protein Neosp_014679 [[Neocosmospora] mangrovei]
MPSVHISQSVDEASLPAFGQKRQNSEGEEHQLESKKPRSEDQHNSTPPGKDAASSSGGNGALNPNEKATFTEKYACFFYKTCPEQCAGFTLSKWRAVLQHLLRVHVLGNPKEANAIQTGTLLPEEYVSIKGIAGSPDESKGITGSPEEIRWKKAWSIIWPELEIPRNSHFEKLVDIQRREAMQPVLKYLKEAGVPVQNLESHAAALIDIVLRIPTPTPRAVGGEAVPAEAVQCLPATASATATSHLSQPNASVQAAQGASRILMPPPGQQMVFGHLPQALPPFAAAQGQQHHIMPAREEPNFYDLDRQTTAQPSYDRTPPLPPGSANSSPNLGPANTLDVPQGFGTLHYHQEFQECTFWDQDGRVWLFPVLPILLLPALDDWDPDELA